MNYKEPVIPLFVEKSNLNYVYQEAKAIGGHKTKKIDPNQLREQIDKVIEDNNLKLEQKALA